MTDKGKLTAKIKVEVSERELLTMLIGVVESNTKAMEKNAGASEKMATEVRGLRRIIAGAQEKIGGEIGARIDHMKETQRLLNLERDAARDAAINADRGEVDRAGG
jgi:hypothetical protein